MKPDPSHDSEVSTAGNLSRRIGISSSTPEIMIPDAARPFHEKSEYDRPRYSRVGVG